MAALVIKDVPPGLHERLKLRAAACRRSMAAETLCILERALADRAGPPTLAEVDALRIRGAGPLTEELLDEARRSGRP